MNIYGLEKLSLVDFDGHTSATVFTGGCNFACPYCHNAPLVLLDGAEKIPEEEVFAYLKKRKGLLDCLCITGGEPTLEKGLADFCRKVKEMGYDVKLDSNGTHPDVLKTLVSEGLIDYVAMDIKNSPEKYPMTVKRKVNMAAIRESVDFLIRSGADYEFRTTAVRELHEESDFEKIGQFIEGAKRYYIQKFRDRGGNLEDGFSEIPEDDAKIYLEKVAKYVEKASLRGY